MTRTRTYTRFLVGEDAPDAVEVSKGASVPNHLGNIALRLNTTDPRLVEIDMTVVPPALHLREAPVALLFGETGPDGKFVQYDNELSRRQSIATGEYIGPGTELRIY